MDAFLDSTLGATPTSLNGRYGRYGRATWGTGIRRRLSVAIVNNMPDSALVATERQFTRLVTEAAGDAVDIGLFHIPGLPRGEEAKQTLAMRYKPVTALFYMHVDAVIVTGNEPRAARINDEPYWDEITQLIDWVAASGSHSLWSCLAAHAAVLHLDGIERRRLPIKKSGVLASVVTLPGQQLPDVLSVCHSRINGLDKGELLGRGYDIISEAAGEHVDMFTKRFGAPFLFLQGHPEYDPDSPMREYRRDVGRYLNGYRDIYPEMPENYFDSATVIRMENYRTIAERTRDIRLFENFPQTSLRASLEQRLAQSAAAVFANWVTQVAADQMAG